MAPLVHTTPRPFDPDRSTASLAVGKQLPTLREFYEELHRIADAMVPRIRRRFLEAVRGVQDISTLREIADAVRTGSVARVIAALRVAAEFGRLLIPMGAVLRRVFEDSARATLEDAGIEASLNLLNQRSVEWLRRYEFDLISPVSVNRLGQNVRVVPATIEGIREVIVDAFERGGHPFEQARRIRNHIGLNARQARALMNFRQMLEEEGVAPARVVQRTDAYYTRLLNARARTIARTESIRASNAGQDEAWRQAQEQDLLDPDRVRRKWIVTRDDRLCPICRSIPVQNPNGVRFNELFRIDPRFGLPPVMHPPAHPNCRCAMGLMRART